MPPMPDMPPPAAMPGKPIPIIGLPIMGLAAPIPPKPGWAPVVPAPDAPELDVGWEPVDEVAGCPEAAALLPFTK